MPVVVGTANADRLTGLVGVGVDALGQQLSIYGRGGNDRLGGHFFADNYLYGETGNDTLEGGTASNFLFGGGGNDTLRLLGMRVDWEKGNLFGGAGNDLLDADSYGVNGQTILDGGSGIDTLQGGDGRDVYFVDHRSDVIVETFVPEFQNVPNPRDEVRAGVNWTLANRLEDLTLTGTGNFSGTGNAASNRVAGNAGANVLNGGAGHDTLNGGAGVDVMVGGAGVDTYFVDRPADRVVETADGQKDRVVATVTWNMQANVDALTLAGTAVSTIGNSLANAITGNALANVLNGAAGDDTIIGGGGDDRINGGVGNDVLDGGLGKDWLIGSTGADTFSFAAASHSGVGIARDVIRDFDPSDVLDLSAIDASRPALGSQTFAFVGGAAFSGMAGELRFAGEVLQADLDGNRTADFEVRLLEVSTLNQSDFIL
jgi:Ca2+-binding RTX toxin-like protein